MSLTQTAAQAAPEMIDWNRHPKWTIKFDMGLPALANSPHSERLELFAPTVNNLVARMLHDMPPVAKVRCAMVGHPADTMIVTAELPPQRHADRRRGRRRDSLPGEGVEGHAAVSVRDPSEPDGRARTARSVRLPAAQGPADRRGPDPGPQQPPLGWRTACPKFSR